MPVVYLPWEGSLLLGAHGRARSGIPPEEVRFSHEGCTGYAAYYSCPGQ